MSNNTQSNVCQNPLTISDQLSQAEQQGIIITDLSRAFHCLLANNNLPVQISRRLLNQSDALLLPDPKIYQSNFIHLNLGDRLPSLTELAEKLVKIGYFKTVGESEVGSFSVKGETITMTTPLSLGHFKLTLHGSIIEQITHVINQRGTLQSRLSIPPINFPPPSIPWRDLIKNYEVVNLIKSTKKYDSPINTAQGFELIGQLKTNHPAVHRDHGIGIYEGLQSRVINQQTKDYIVLRYAEGDTLSVPVEFAHKVTAYVGSGHPPIHRLSQAALWQKNKRQATADAAAFAKELLTIASHRQNSQRSPYQVSPSTENLLDTNFPYQLTPDQVAAWTEVKQDLLKNTPADRLIVGDVGFGKTEIALRAAYHVATSADLPAGRQVALIAPTTLLVQQHYDTFKNRFPQLSNQIGLLSRFVSPKEQKITKEKISSGALKIIIGTHALLDPKISWPNLSLIIIDEEQRFGVKQKEVLKKIRATADVISLSATPIPRTLSMSLTGLRDLSIISTPPAGRQSVKTSVAGEDNTVVTQAIQPELTRNGQVYVVAPHIRRLPALRQQIQRLFPSATTAIAHGQLPDQQLAAIMHQFDSGKIDILICSSIVENGLDLPNANTILVFQATHFGLSDLYQLRGRVGRRQRQGHAYFLYDPAKPLTSLQRQRLTAITENQRLGSGWDLARRDLEIRGAGNLLGSEQSGSVNTVGLQLYLDLLHEEINKANSPTGTLTRQAVDISLPLTAIIPNNYIKNPDTRAKTYQQLTRAQSITDLNQRVSQLEITYGSLPLATQNLIAILKLQHTAAANGITSITTSRVTPPTQAPFYKLTLHTTNTPAVLQKLSKLGDWQVQAHSLTINQPHISQQLIQSMINLLTKS